MNISTNAAKTLEQVGRRLHWPVLITLLVVVGAYAGFAVQQYGRLNDLNQRELANAAAQLKRSLENAVETVKRFTPSDTNELDASATNESPLCRFDRNQPYLALVPPDQCAQRLGPFTEVEPSTEAPLALTAKTKLAEKVTFRFLAEIVLGELSFPESFGLIFIADEDGRVLYQDAPSKRVWLRHLGWGERHFRDSGSRYDGSAVLSQLKHLFGDDRSSGWTHVSAASGRITAPLAGQDHAVYFEPLTLENGRQLRLVLGGAVPRHSLVRQALAVDSYFLTVLVLLLLLAFLGLPFVKLISLDARERFGLGDVTALYLSTAALLTLFTFATEAVLGYVRWRDLAGEGLAQLAARLDQEVVEEVRDIRDTLEGYDRTIGGLDIDALVTRPSFTDWYNEKHWNGCPRSRVSVDGHAVGLDDPCPLPLPTLGIHIENVSWIARSGKQLWKTTADTMGAKQQDLSNRVYFRSVRDGHLFEIAGTSTPFFFGPDRSVTNGKFYTFVSMPSQIRVPQGPDAGPVVVMATTQLFSLRAPALPAGYGFTVIDRMGRVLYHSDARLSLRENLFDEMSKGARARAMVYAGHEASMTSGYRERPHEFHLRPLSITLAADHASSGDRRFAGLYVVTFRDTSLEMATIARAFLQSLLGPGLVLIAFIGVSIGAMALVAKGKGDHWSVWLWPNGLAHVYKRLSAALAVALAVGLLALARGASDLVLVGLPVTALVSAVGIYGFGGRRRPTRSVDSRHWHSLMFLLFLICTIVVPASAIFRTAVAHEFGKRVVAEQAWMAALCTDLPAVVRAEVRAEDRPELMGNRMARAAEMRCGGSDLRRAPAPFAVTPASMTAETHWLLTAYHWTDDLLPIGSDYAARIRYEEHGSAEIPSLTSGPVTWGSRWGLLLYGSVLTALAWWMRRKADLLFFADQESAAPDTLAPGEAWASCSPEERLVLARAVLDGIVNPYQRPHVETLLRRGVLTLDPNLRPRPELATFIRDRKVALHEELRRSEIVESDHGWRYARVVLVASGVGLLLFLAATQPGLQSEFIGIATAVSGALASGMKLWESVASRLQRKVTTA